MADLTLRADERSQILLIGAFALAALFVTLALILNVVIYTENLATRTESTTSDAVAHSQSVERATVDLLEYINEYETSGSADYEDLGDKFREGFGNFTTGMTRYQLTSGVVAKGTIRNQFNGTWLKQTNESRNFTNKRAGATWSPVNGSANGARSFRFKITNVDSLPSPGFRVTASDSSAATWVLEVDSSDVQVTDAGGNTITCSAGSGTVWVNVSEGTVDGSPCPGLDFGDDLDTIESIKFDYADHPEGTYRLMVNKTEANVDPGSKDFDPTSTKVPFTNRSLYGAVVGIDYESTTLVYRTDRRVVPGEIDG